MISKDKELLLKDLCARLPYGVKVQSYNYEKDIETIETLSGIDSDGYMSTTECDTLKNIAKPYLFPLSSMTEEQYYELQNCSSDDCLEHMELVKTLHDYTDFTHWPLYSYRVIDWFHKNHFDYRGLIPMGLAKDATGKNIY